jgi:hypothetical protein
VDELCWELSDDAVDDFWFGTGCWRGVLIGALVG